MLYQLLSVSKIFSVGSSPVNALRDVTLEIERGEMIALTGTSGSGKSTLLSLLGLMDSPSAGEMSFAGSSTAGLDDRELTRRRRDAIGFVFQNFNLVPTLSARENVEYALHLQGLASVRELRDRVDEALASVGMSAHANHRPAELSGGQRQRVAIARALVKAPKVLLADEPTANLDSQTARQIIELLHGVRARSGTTVILATHDRDQARAADRIIRLHDGELVDCETSGRVQNE